MCLNGGCPAVTGQEGRAEAEAAPGERAGGRCGVVPRLYRRPLPEGGKPVQPAGPPSGAGSAAPGGASLARRFKSFALGRRALPSPPASRSSSLALEPVRGARPAAAAGRQPSRPAGLHPLVCCLAASA